jgi:predicted DNA-binding transcriptional regulator AlpA
MSVPLTAEEHRPAGFEWPIMEKVTGTMRNELQTVLMAARELAAGELPRLLGELEEIRCTAMARLTAPAPVQPQTDELLSAPEAARRLGISQDYLYRHHGDFPFTRRVGRRLLFSALGIDKYIRQQKCIDSNTAHKYIQPVGFPTRG